MLWVPEIDTLVSSSMDDSLAVRAVIPTACPADRGRRCPPRRAHKGCAARRVQVISMRNIENSERRHIEDTVPKDTRRAMASRAVRQVCAWQGCGGEPV